METRLLLPDDVDLTSLSAMLDDAVVADPSYNLRATYLDTFDWRVATAGGRLTREDERGRSTLHWQPAGPTQAYVLPIDGDVRFTRDLPDGHLRAELEPILEVRALLPMGQCRVRRTRGRVVDRAGNAAIRLVLEKLQPLDTGGRPAAEPKTVLRLQPIGREDGGLVELLHDLGAVDLADFQDLELVTAARGRRPGDYSSKPKVKLTPGQRAGDALRAILARLLETLEANVPGVIEDIDPEFLHDLRVATRRTRSAIAQVKGVLPQADLDVFAPEFRWLGTVTGPLRDLDVYLIEMDTYRRMLGDTADELEPLERLIRRARRHALRRVRSSLRAQRFQRLLDDWHAFLSTPDNTDPEPDNAARPIADVAGERILRAYTRIVKRGSRFGDDPPAEALHRLRIDAKKLRYLLEFFASLYPAKSIARLVKELKQLQDILGGFNDMVVQQARLEEFAQELMSAGDARAGTLLAMGRLAAALERRQQDFRHAFAGRFAEVAADSSRTRYRTLVAGG